MITSGFCHVCGGWINPYGKRECTADKCLRAWTQKELQADALSEKELYGLKDDKEDEQESDVK